MSQSFPSVRNPGREPPVHMVQRQVADAELAHLTDLADTARVHAAVQDEVQHVLPTWVNWVQEHLLLSFLMIAEAYLLGTLMSLGWVANIEDPQRWGIYHGIGVVLFFLGGAGAAGFAIKCSVASAAYLKQRKWFFFLLNQAIMWGISLAEIWASLSERSANLHPTPADSAVLSLFGLHNAPISPTVVVVACLLPFASLSYGYSQSQQRRVSQAELSDAALRRRAKLQAEIEQARAKAEMRKIGVAGWAGALRAGLNEVQRQDDSVSVQQPLAVAPDGFGGIGEASDRMTGEDHLDEAEATQFIPFAPAGLPSTPEPQNGYHSSAVSPFR